MDEKSRAVAPEVDALIDRVLERTVSSAINGNRAWAVEARSYLGSPSRAADIRAYAAKAAAFLESQARLYQQSAPSEASAIRVAAAAIRKTLPKAKALTLSGIGDRAEIPEENPKCSRERSDDLATEIDFLVQQESLANPTPVALMGLLQARAGSTGSCVVEAGETRGSPWIKWKNANTGKVRTLDMEALKSRVNRRQRR